MSVKFSADEDPNTTSDTPKDEAEPVANGVDHQNGDKVKKEDADEEMPAEEEQKKQEEEKKPKEISPELAQRADQLLHKREELKEGNVKTAASVALSAAAVKAKVLANILGIYFISILVFIISIFLIIFKIAGIRSRVHFGVAWCETVELSPRGS